MPDTRFRNTVLNALDPGVIERLKLHPVIFDLDREIEFPGNPIHNIFFVEHGMASMTVSFEDGAQVEVGMFGYESVIGVSALMGTKRSLNRVYTQIAGDGFASPIELARKEFLRGGEFHALALGYVQAQLLQSAQSTACNIKHDINQRLARWLLICSDRAQSNHYRMSHQLLADMLGNTRASVSIAAGHFRDEGLIEYHRGAMHLLDLHNLEKRSCECYRVIKNYLENISEYSNGALA